MTHVTIDIWSRPVIRDWGPDNSRRVNTDCSGRGNYRGAGADTRGSFVVWVPDQIETSRRIKGPPYLRSKPRASEDLFWLDWVFASEQSELVMAGSDRVLTGDSFRFRRDFGFSAVWIPCPMSGDSRWEEGRKETTTYHRSFSTWDSEALKSTGPGWGVTLTHTAGTSDTGVSAQLRAARSVACSEARRGTLSVLWSVGVGTTQSGVSRARLWQGPWQCHVTLVLQCHTWQ